MEHTGKIAGSGLGARGGSILLVLLCALALLFPAAACSSTGDSADGDEAVAEASEETGSLALRLMADGWDGGVVPVRVSGSQDDGEKINATLSVKPGEDYELSYSAGSYTFAVDGSDLTSDVTVYGDAEKSVQFDGEGDEVVSLEVPVDAEATEELSEKKEAEEAARAQAEAEEAERARAEAEAAAQAQAQAEAEAAARAQAEAEAAAQAQAQAQAQKNEQTVYITNTGAKYHNAGCRYLKSSSIPISLSAAVAQGYTPCKVCH